MCVYTRGPLQCVCGNNATHPTPVSTEGGPFNCYSLDFNILYSFNACNVAIVISLLYVEILFFVPWIELMKSANNSLIMTNSTGLPNIFILLKFSLIKDSFFARPAYRTNL